DRRRNRLVPVRQSHGGGGGNHLPDGRNAASRVDRPRLGALHRADRRDSSLDQGFTRARRDGSAGKLGLGSAGISGSMAAASASSARSVSAGPSSAIPIGRPSSVYPAG